MHTVCALSACVTLARLLRGSSHSNWWRLTWIASFPGCVLQDTMNALLEEEAALAQEIAEEEAQRQAQLASMREKMGSMGVHDEL